jgi:hypothetical protein
MSLFGWSYPAGCSGTPYDDDYPCELCQVDPSWCACPTCGVCGAQGDPDCYDNEGHGLEETPRQAVVRQRYEAFILARTDPYTYKGSAELLDDFATLGEPQQ